MVIIHFAACMLAGPTCEAVVVRAPEMTRLFCELRGGQEVAAAWIARHPDYRVSGRIACRTDEDA